MEQLEIDGLHVNDGQSQYKSGRLTFPQGHDERTLSARTKALVNAALDALDAELCQPEGDQFTGPWYSRNYFKLRLSGLPREHFAVAYLDSRMRLIACETLFMGGIDQAEIHIRVIAQRAMHHNAASIVLGHNHPSGNATPSAGDKAVTQRIRSAMQLFQVTVQDHIIVGAGSALSMCEHGHME